MDTFDKIEEYLASAEEYVFSSFTAVAHGFPDVHEVANRLWIDISRYGPGLPAFPEVHIPSLGDFQVPPPPPPPPAFHSIGWLEKYSSWVTKHPWKMAGIAVTAVGTGLLVHHSIAYTRRGGVRRLSAQHTRTAERRQVVILLGADSPFGLPLILGLEKEGYIVIASVASPEAAEPLEQQTHGYVKVLVLDPYEPLMIPAFLRSLQATLSRKFPVNTPGDPYAPLSSHPYIHSVISLLTLPTASANTLSPLESLSLPETYFPYLTATHITPLQVIQALLPLLRIAPVISHDKGKKTIIVCLPATDTRVGLPFAGARSMSAASTLRGVEVLRREIAVAAATGKGEAMRNVRVVVVDVGTFDIGPGNVHVKNLYKAMEGWTASEKVTYGPAFAGMLQGTVAAPRSPWKTFVAVFKGTNMHDVTRRPTNVSVFVDNMIGVVSGGRNKYTVCGIGLGIGIGKIRDWVRGERFSIGAGAHTYQFASHLPSALLDILLNIPHFLIGVRNRLLVTQPYRHPRPNMPPPTTGPGLKTASASANPTPAPAASEHGGQGDALSEHDAESVSGDSFDSSWVSLNGSQASGIQEDE